MQLTYKCYLCNKTFTRNNGLAYHLKFTHHITFKEHYDKFIKTDNEGVCAVCGKPTSWRGSSYLVCCSNKCGTIYSKDKRQATMFEKYGAKTTLESKELRNKMENTCERLYNTKNPGSFGGQIFETALQTKYGVKNFLSTFTREQRTEYGKLGHTSEAAAKYKTTMLNLYGVTHPSLSNESFRKMRRKYTFDNKTFDSASELTYYIWLKDHNIDFEYQPNIVFDFEFDNEIKHYRPDFRVGSDIIEIKGLQFFENKDINRKMCCPYHYDTDTEEDIAQRNALYEAKHQCMLQNHVKIITDYSEYENYVNEKYTKDFVNLFKNDLDFPYLNTNLKNKGDLGLIQHFHKSIYEAHRKNKPSPIEAWNNKELIYKCALNRLKYMGHCKPNDILQGFNVTKIAPKVSVFKPELATRLVNQYLTQYNTIVDPFSGFSGRMLGAVNCNKTYIGYDINEKHIQESQEIIDYKHITNTKIYVEDLITAPTRTYENAALFTCPPYGGKERWNKDNVEIEKTCDEWIALCIEKHKCTRYVFVVDETEKYKDCIIETLTNTSHFGSNNEYVILIDMTY